MPATVVTCSRCGERLSVAACVRCQRQLCATCLLVPEREHAAHWACEGIYYPGVVLQLDAAYAREEAERILGSV